MGITNLLPQLKNITTKITLSSSKRRITTLNNEPTTTTNTKRHKPNNYNNQQLLRTAIDISSWIAKACHGHGSELLDERHLSNFGRVELLHEKQLLEANNNNNNDDNNNNDKQNIEDIQNFISKVCNTVLKRISSLQACLSTDILIVFDGDTPPMKRICCEQRKKIKNDAAMTRDEVVKSNPNVLVDDDDDNHNNNMMMQSNLNKISAANKAGAHTNEIYQAVVNSLLKSLREKKIPFMISPYEADGQLAYLSNEGLIDLIISEDSDFIGHGCKAVLYKYRAEQQQQQQQNGNNKQSSFWKVTGDLIRRNDVNAVNTSFDLSSFSDIMLTIFCVATGCDYCNSLKGIGIKTAKNVVEEAFQQKKSKTPKLELVLDLLFKACYDKKSLSVEDKKRYTDNFIGALIMFRHPIVFDPINVTLRFANYDKPDPELMTFKPYATIFNDKSKMEQIVGKLYCTEMALNVVEGHINPKTWSMFCEDVSESQDRIRDLLKRWNKETLTLESEATETKHNNENNKTGKSTLQHGSQSSNGTSSASKFSSQTSNRSSNTSALSPILLA